VSAIEDINATGTSLGNESTSSNGLTPSGLYDKILGSTYFSAKVPKRPYLLLITLWIESKQPSRTTNSTFSNLLSAKELKVVAAPLDTPNNIIGVDFPCVLIARLYFSTWILMSSSCPRLILRRSTEWQLKEWVDFFFLACSSSSSLLSFFPFFSFFPLLEICFSPPFLWSSLLSFVSWCWSSSSLEFFLCSLLSFFSLQASSLSLVVLFCSFFSFFSLKWSSSPLDCLLCSFLSFFSLWASSSSLEFLLSFILSFFSLRWSFSPLDCLLFSFLSFLSFFSLWSSSSSLEFFICSLLSFASLWSS